MKIDIVDKILSKTKGGDYLENPNKQAEVKKYERQIDPVRDGTPKVSDSCLQQPISNGVDQMVYKLYGLTEEEIKTVEGGEIK